jgi:hypothetical protein
MANFLLLYAGLGTGTMQGQGATLLSLVQPPSNRNTDAVKQCGRGVMSAAADGAMAASCVGK